MEPISLEGIPNGVNNRSLFSNYYLTELVRDDSFLLKSTKQAKEVWLLIRAQYEKVKELLKSANEAETEHRFIRPVLNILGYKDLYSLRPLVPSPEGIRRPDFAFFTSIEDLTEAEKNLKGKKEYFAKALAVGDAKQWERSLDRKIKGPGDPFTNQNPSYQIDFYLRATDKTWGILMNGRHWRLYHRDTSYRMTVFYEIDLPAILEEYDDSFLYFYTFFRNEALTSGFLDRAYKESQEYVAKLGDELKENVYEALRFLAEGFLRFPENKLSKDNQDKIRENTFVLIYRLLFIFYAEDRGLLPLENRNYRSYSLRELAREIAERLDRAHAFSPTAQGYWARLQDLFRTVNEGDDHLSVPPYNGGLFDEGRHPFLERYKVGDLYLARAIDRLARAEAAGRTGRGPVSYRDLEIRHIGAIYEGLLEHRLRVAEQEIAVVKEKGREKFIPIAELNGRKPLKTYQAGEVYLETDKGERKATGSYYTPDYIVKYIVQNTLGPLIEEKRKEIEQAKHELEERFKRSRGYNREVYEKQLQEIGNRLIDEILSIKVLDPAMGSGHFLVEATDFSEYEKPFWKKKFISASGAYDIYILFFELGLQLGAKERLVSLITPNKFLSAPYAVAFRKLIASMHEFISLCNWSKCKVFEDPAIYPIVSVFRRMDKSPQPYIIHSLSADINGSPSAQVIMHESAKLTMLPDFLWGFLLSENINLVEKISSLSESLHKIATVQATSTAAEADEFAAVIKEGKASTVSFKLINTGLIDRYATLWGIEPLDHKGASYKKPYLDLNSSVVSETRRNLYRQPKIIFAKMALRIEGFLDILGEYASVNTNCVYDSRYELAYICALVNSRLLSFVYAEYFSSLMMSGGYFQFQAPQLENLPIRRIAFTTPKEERARLVEEGKEMYFKALVH